jgi:hypothetical protein
VPTGGTVVAHGGQGSCGGVVVAVLGVDGVCDVLVVPALLVFVPVPLPEFRGGVDVPVPAPDGTQGGEAVGCAGVVGVVGVVCGVGASVPDVVGAVVPDGVGVVGCVWFCAAMPSTDIADANASAVVSLVNV